MSALAFLQIFYGREQKSYDFFSFLVLNCLIEVH